MHLAHDYVHPTPRGGRCRVRLYLPEDLGASLDAPVVLCSELPENPGTSVTNAAEHLAAEVIAAHGLEKRPPIWVEHYPRSEAERQAGLKETFDLVIFEDHDVREVLKGGEWRRTIGEPTWRTLDRASVEALIGGLLG